MVRFFKSLYLEKRLVWLLGLNVFIFALGFAYPFFFAFAKGFFIAILSLVLIDIFLLYQKRKGLKASRNYPTLLSNGDDNEIELRIESGYSIPIYVKIIEELPFEFNKDNFELACQLSPSQQKKHITYSLRPTTRGEYSFGMLNCFAFSSLGIVSRKFILGEPITIPVYPSFIQLKKYEFLAISNQLFEAGAKRLKKVGQSTEFDQIRDYSKDDDYRLINWKATARKGILKVNQYQDEKSQNIYCIIDKGRSMKMPFEGMSLVDYAINASLVLSSIALKKDDKAGLITFSNKMGTILKADQRRGQNQQILQALYNQTTRFQESDFARLYRNIKQVVKSRSLLLLFTNFESMNALKRQIPYLQAIAREHLLVVIFFENDELNKVIEAEPESLKQIYDQAVAEKFKLEKKQIQRELTRHGILSIMTVPQQLTANTINKYLEIKSQGVI